MGFSFTAYGFNKRWNPKRFCAFLLLLVSMFTLTGCDPYASVFPSNEEAVWTCNDPYIMLAYRQNEDGRMICEATLDWNGEVIPIVIGYRSAVFVARKQTNLQRDIFRGEWEFRDSKLILTIEEDYIFDGQYKELVFETEDDVKLPKQYANIWKKHFGTAVLGFGLAVLIEIAKPGIVILAVIVVIWILVKVFRRKREKHSQNQNDGNESLAQKNLPAADSTKIDSECTTREDDVPKRT